MSTRKHALRLLLGVLMLGLALVSVSIEPVLSHRINPVAFTRYTIEQCEQVETEVISGIGRGVLPPDLESAFGLTARQSTAFRGGLVRVSGGVRSVVVDAWEQPLHMVRKSELVTLANVSRHLVSKTNAVIIWSSGPNRSNEYGNGDDVVSRPAGAN